jgi:hypothetical protein
MLVKRYSVVQQQFVTMDLPIMAEQLETWEKSDILCQHFFPDLTPRQREFLITGTTPEDWDKIFGPSE